MWRPPRRFLFIALLTAGSTQSFSPSLVHHRHNNSHGKKEKVMSSLAMAQQQFDMSRETFDLLSLRSVRGDALIRYNTLNQSEPLRINLYGLLSIILAAAPALTEAVGNDEMGLVGRVGSALGALGSFAIFFSNCQSRAKQLNRMEKELMTGSLLIRPPANTFSDQAFGKALTLEELRKSSKPPRILALCGTQAKVAQALQGLNVVRRRLEQASVFVVAITTDSTSGALDKQIAYRGPWFTDAYEKSMWIDFFDGLINSDSESEFRWFGLNSNGRSFGSGSGEIPQWIQVLGQHLRPTDILDSSDYSIAEDDASLTVLKAQSSFYKALTTGDETAMLQVCGTRESADVTEVLEAGGRLDSWTACLKEDARPTGMVISGSDAMIVSETEAYSTTIEFPTETGIDEATLLAVQKWSRPTVDDDWKLELHQTIPWTNEFKAQGTLRCDCRGCVALTRGSS